MTFVPLTQLPWRRKAARHRALPHHWVEPLSLAPRIDAWRHWLADHPGGEWLLYQPHPGDFCAALIALWESGRVAVLPADDRPATLARIAHEVDGTLPDTPGDQAEHAAREPLSHPASLCSTATAIVLHTSGSTGAPVRITKRFDQLEAEIAAHANLWPLADGCVISQVSHQHIYGLLTGVLHPLCAGVPFCGDTCCYPETLAARLQEAGDAHLAPVVVSSPAQLTRLPEHLPWRDLPRPLRVFSSGAPLSSEHAQRTESLLDAPVIEIYGSTETGGIAHRRQSQRAIWQPLPGVQVSCEEAHLAVRSPFLQDPQQWWQQPDRVAPVQSGFELLGRADRVVKIAGKRVSLSHIERTLATAEEVNDARCIDLGRSDGRLGVVAVLPSALIPHEHTTRHALIQRLRAHLSHHLERVTIPRYWRFVDALPCNAQSKLDRSLINQLFADLDDTQSPRWLGDDRPDPDTCWVTLEVPERLIFLKGHFDEYPLVPGVVMVQWAIQLAAERFGQHGEFQGIERLKFQRALRPGTRFTLKLTRRDDGLAFCIDSHEGRHCSGQVRMHIQEGRQHG
ncbi:MAG: AMP-binding protein [Halomonas sp.]|nr:AMP-binding protein [Halomonas sp.]